jgi:hypothetical protein
MSFVLKGVAWRTTGYPTPSSVSNEYGSAVGICTIEDLLEIIVGDIDDEYDTEPRSSTPSGPACGAARCGPAWRA